ncbi:hypothetical protein Salpa_5446 [Sporomusa sp. KB1]|jgi:hypothetical protein|nr:hypothetical protein Salpa_5446 [Sporomusa sp. KB1]
MKPGAARKGKWSYIIYGQRNKAEIESDINRLVNILDFHPGKR